jgi:cation diffusion facilitator family transporter
MIDLFIRIFVKDCENVKAQTVRSAYGRLAGVTGVCLNLLLSAAKLAAGAALGSIAVLADGANNLSDAASSVVMLVGFRLAAAPGDREHPYGHARIEYLTGLFISIIIILLGAKLLTDSIDRVLRPDPAAFSVLVALVLVAAVPVKIWLFLLFRRIGRRIGSGALEAAGIDNRNDALATLAALASMLAWRFSGFDADGYAGCLIAAYIIVSGVKLVRDTSDPLLGKAPDPDLVKAIEGMICGAEAVVGIHDLAVHDYGPGRVFATAHAEVDVHEDFVKCHDVIDGVEREVDSRLGVSLVIHMDPIDTKDPLTLDLKKRLETLAGGMPGVLGIHDLRIVKGYTRSKIIFDVVLSPECAIPAAEIRAAMEEDLRRVDDTYRAVIVFDTDYTGP